MEGKVVYSSLKDAASSLNADAQKISGYIDDYMQSVNQIGKSGSSAWGGTAAEQAVPVLTDIKSDITQLQEACSEFSDNVNAALNNYEQTDAMNINKVTDIKG